MNDPGRSTYLPTLPHPAPPRHGRRLAWAVAMAAGLATTALLGGAVALIDRRLVEHAADAERVQVVTRLAEVRSGIEAAVNLRLWTARQLAQRLGSELDQGGKPPTAEGFAVLARPLVDNSPGVVEALWMVDGAVRGSYPRRPATDPAPAAITPGLTGPVPLLQGGQGVCIAMPVPTARTDPAGGMAVVVVEVHGLLADAGLAQGVALLELSLSTGAGRLLGGEAALLAATDAEALPLGLPGTDWVLRARPRGGWPERTGAGLALAGLGAVAALLAGVAVFALVLAPFRLRRRISEISAALAEREEGLGRALRMRSARRLAASIATSFESHLLRIAEDAREAQRHLPQNHVAARSLVSLLQRVEQALAQSEHLLAFASRQRLSPAPVAASALLSGVRPLLEAVVGPGILLVVEPCERPVTVRLDTGLFEQALMHLAINACDAMPQGGTLTILADERQLPDPVTVDAPRLPPGPYLAIACTDTGSGIAPELHERIFEPFFSTKPDGAGLGLSAAHGIIAQTGGAITVRSRPGQGSTFTIWLPVGGLAEAGPGPVANGPVLLVEPRADLRTVLREWLEEDGFPVVEASQAATPPAGTVPVAAVVATTVAAEVRATFPALPLVVVGDRQGHLPAGPVAFCAAPVSSQTLAQTLRQLLAK